MDNESCLDAHHGLVLSIWRDALLSSAKTPVKYDSITELVSNNLGAPVVIGVDMGYPNSMSFFFRFIVDFSNRRKPIGQETPTIITVAHNRPFRRSSHDLSKTIFVGVLEYTPERKQAPARVEFDHDVDLESAFPTFPW